MCFFEKIQIRTLESKDGSSVTGKKQRILKWILSIKPCPKGFLRSSLNPNLQDFWSVRSSGYWSEKKTYTWSGWKLASLLFYVVTLFQTNRFFSKRSALYRPTPNRQRLLLDTTIDQDNLLFAPPLWWLVSTAFSVAKISFVHICFWFLNISFSCYIITVLFSC